MVAGIALSNPDRVYWQDVGVTKQALCPDGFVSISGGLQGEAEVTAACQIRESHPAPDGSAWVSFEDVRKKTTTGAAGPHMMLFDPSVKLGPGEH